MNLNFDEFDEIEMHPYLVYFANQTFSCYSKTISEKTSSNTKAGENKWIHPDIVAFKLLRNDFEEEVQEFYRHMNRDAAYLYSFELKKEVKLRELKEVYFQAVSNSSWANEGYLVTALLNTEDKALMSELERLTQAFGIGVILLDLIEVENSKVLFEAQRKLELDFFTINKLIRQKNSHFKTFIQSVNDCLKNKSTTIETAVISQNMDKIKSVEELNLKFKKLEDTILPTDLKLNKLDRINSSWMPITNTDFTFKKIEKIKINDTVIEVATWREFLIKMIEFCEEKNPQLFKSHCYLNSEGEYVFLEKRANYWNHDRSKEFTKMKDNLYIYTSLSAKNICKEVVTILKIFNIPVQSVSIKIK